MRAKYFENKAIIDARLAQVGVKKSQFTIESSAGYSAGYFRVEFGSGSRSFGPMQHQGPRLGGSQTIRMGGDGRMGHNLLRNE